MSTSNIPAADSEITDNPDTFVHNAEVQDNLLDVIEYLSNEQVVPSAALASARYFSSGQKRQKLSKLADKTEADWLAMEEYESDELLDDSDDEKRIKKAQEKACRNKKQIGLARTKRQKVAPTLATYQASDQQRFRGNLFRPAFFVDSTYLLGSSQACSLCLLLCVMQD